MEILRKGRAEKHGCLLTNRNAEINAYTNSYEPLDTHNFVEALEALSLVEKHFKDSRKSVYWKAARGYFLQGNRYIDQEVLRLDGRGYCKNSSTRTSVLRTLEEARRVLGPRQQICRNT